jgi:hypothetical protein
MILTQEDVAEFQRLAEMDEVKLTEDEVRDTAMRLILLYRHLARPTPNEEVAKLARLDVRQLTVSDSTRQRR